MQFFNHEFSVAELVIAFAFAILADRALRLSSTILTRITDLFATRSVISTKKRLARLNKELVRFRRHMGSPQLRATIQTFEATDCVMKAILVLLSVVVSTYTATLLFIDNMFRKLQIPAVDGRGGQTYESMFSNNDRGFLAVATLAALIYAGIVYYKSVRSLFQLARFARPRAEIARLEKRIGKLTAKLPPLQI